MKTKSDIAFSLTEMFLEDAKNYFNQRLNEECEKILAETRLKLMSTIQFTIREDIISDRLVMTLQVNKIADVK